MYLITDVSLQRATSSEYDITRYSMSVYISLFTCDYILSICNFRFAFVNCISLFV